MKSVDVDRKIKNVFKLLMICTKKTETLILKTILHLAKRNCFVPYIEDHIFVYQTITLRIFSFQIFVVRFKNADGFDMTIKLFVFNSNVD